MEYIVYFGNSAEPLFVAKKGERTTWTKDLKRAKRFSTYGSAFKHMRNNALTYGAYLVTICRESEISSQQYLTQILTVY